MRRRSESILRAGRHCQRSEALPSAGGDPFVVLSAPTRLRRIDRIARGVAFALVLVLGGCAKQTRDIEAAAVDPAIFVGATCSQLVAERAKRSQALIFAGLAQDQVSADDRVRTFGAPTPMGTLFEGDREDEVARLKGELHAANAQMIVMNCGPDYR